MPSGWAKIEKKYVKWEVGPTADQRKFAKPFNGQIILMLIQKPKFSSYWSEVCKQAGATVCLIQTINDIAQQTQSAFMLIDDEISHETKSIVDKCGILIVSSVWLVQCLILGKPLEPNLLEKLKKKGIMMLKSLQFNKIL